MDKKQTEIRIEITAVKQAIMDLGPMRPGSLSRQKRSWGKAYWHLNYYLDGKNHTEFIREEELSEVQMEMENFRQFKELSKRLIYLSVADAKFKKSADS